MATRAKFAAAAAAAAAAAILAGWAGAAAGAPLAPGTQVLPPFDGGPAPPTLAAVAFADGQMAGTIESAAFDEGGGVTGFAYRIAAAAGSAPIADVIIPDWTAATIVDVRAAGDGLLPAFISRPLADLVFLTFVAPITAGEHSATFILDVTGSPTLGTAFASIYSTAGDAATPGVAGLTPTPEPAAATLLGTGLAAVLALSRRMKNRPARGRAGAGC